MKFDLVRPCEKCPFRTDCLKGWLGTARAVEIASGLVDRDQSFPCHETTAFSEDSEIIPDHDREQHCAGAAIMLEKLGHPNQWMRWMERLGMYDRRKLDMAAPVFTTVAAFIQHHTEKASRTKRKRRGR